MTEDATSAYIGVAAAWEAGPAKLYARLAEHVVACYPQQLEGRRVLDLGAGAGAVSRALMARGARPCAVDLAPDMVERMRAAGIDAVCADLLSLPFDRAAFDGAVAAFSVSHVGQPVAALREAARVVAPRGAVVVAAFATDHGNASKQAVDAVAAQFGYRPPAWYTRFKLELEPRCGSTERLAAIARDASLHGITVRTDTVETGIDTPDAVVASRMGMAHLAPFVASLSDAHLAEFVAAACAAVARAVQPLAAEVLVLSSTVAA